MDKTTENTDESFLRWRVSIEEDDNNSIEEAEYDGEPLLKTVVRTNYLYHLRQSLRKNLESLKQTNNCSIEENNVNKVIKGCSALLEEKALRNCMIARLYQRMMAQIIKDVKKSTSDGLLYSPLKEFAERQSRTPAPCLLDRECQTEINGDFFNNLLAELHQQTKTLLRNSKSFTESTEIANSIDSVSTTTPKKDPKSINGVRANWCVKCNRETFNSLCTHSPRSKPSRSSHSQYTDAGVKTDERSETMNGIIEKFSYPVDQVKTGHCETEAKPNEPSQFSSYDKNDTFQLKLRSSSFVEAVAYWYSLECEIDELPPAKRQKLDEHYVRLFGKDHAIDYYFLTDDQKTMACRKRIAKYVVVELTDYYSKKMIASKQLFKTMAKHITSLVLDRSLYPGVDVIKRSVDEFFHDGRIINSEEDFYM